MLTSFSSLKFNCEDGAMLAQVAQRSFGCSIPGSVEGQAEWGLEQCEPSGRCPCPRQGAWNEMGFESPLPKPFYDSINFFQTPAPTFFISCCMFLTSLNLKNISNFYFMIIYILIESWRFSQDREQFVLVQLHPWDLVTSSKLQMQKAVVLI